MATVIRNAKLTLVPGWIYRKNPSHYIRIGYADCDIED